MRINQNISDSDSRVELLHQVPWMLIWTVAIALFSIGLGLSESGWRALGYQPSVVDSPALWKFWYERAASGGPRTIVLIGASRIQAGVSTTQLRKRLIGYRIVQLGRYAGGSPIGLLRTLAADLNFNGIVICDTLTPFLVRRNWDEQQREYTYRGNLKERLDAIISACAHDMLAISNTETGVDEALKRLVNEGHLPRRGHVRMRADRALELDFSRVENLERFRAASLAEFRRRYETADHPMPEELDDDFQEIDGFVRRIQGRGGQVIFLSMPSSGGRHDLEERYHPKSNYWDRFAAMSSGVCVHSAELARAVVLNCADDSHLDYCDSVLFTNIFVDEIIHRKAVTVR